VDQSAPDDQFHEIGDRRVSGENSSLDAPVAQDRDAVGDLPHLVQIV
jgi:hypothetical protein